MGIVYLLHFDPPYRHAGHYLGWTAGMAESRLAQHLKGHGSPLVHAQVQAGGAVVLARTWEGDRHFERRLKKHGKARICPMCTASPR